MKRVAPTTDNQIPLQIALTNDFLRYHQTCTVAPAKVERNNEKQQGKDKNDLTDILLKSQEALHTEMVNDFDRAHETFMEKLEDDMDVTQQGNTKSPQTTLKLKSVYDYFLLPAHKT